MNVHMRTFPDYVSRDDRPVPEQIDEWLNFWSADQIVHMSHSTESNRNYVAGQTVSVMVVIK